MIRIGAVETGVMVVGARVGTEPSGGTDVEVVVLAFDGRFVVAAVAGKPRSATTTAIPSALTPRHRNVRWWFWRAEIGPRGPVFEKSVCISSPVHALSGFSSPAIVRIPCFSPVPAAGPVVPSVLPHAIVAGHAGQRTET